ncbi:SIMPL domain-containing protein [Caulobacter sp.]|uniref:SIMPL domain-containing protein n=1 Tax=Caulobacter sp. TaxID=78 RepID=UPI003BB02047
MRLLVLVSLLGIAPSPLLAQTLDPTKPTITVIGDGRAETPAEFAWLSFNLRGEGPTSPEAVTALTTTHRKLDASFRALPGKPALETRDGTLSIREVRPKACTVNYGAPNLSTGECAVIGSIATTNVQVKVTPAKQVGDVASLAAQLGAADVNVSNGGLTDTQPLEDKAMRLAVADARRQAQLIADASGRTLGSILRIQDSQTSVNSPLPMPPPPAPPPAYEAREDIVISAAKLAAPLAMTPPTITRAARVSVTYSLLP